jgi:dipeptidase E
MELLLLSNSRSPGQPMFAHAAEALVEFVAGRRVTFLPYARTTNDMPIVEPESFQALGLIPFQINPHYLDPDPASTHMGETREERLLEFLEENDVPVLGLREGSWLRVAGGGKASLGGPHSARLFERGRQPVELPAGAELSSLLAAQARFDTP